MIEVKCPYCMRDIKIDSSEELYTFKRIGETLHSCNICKRTMRVYDDAGTIKTLRMMKREVKYEYKDL